MKSAPFCVVACLLLAACGPDGSGPDERKALAQCMLDPKATGNYGMWMDEFISTCMQAKGYVVDDRLMEEDGSICREDATAYRQADCYRNDTDFAKWIVGLSAQRKKSN